MAYSVAQRVISKKDSIYDYCDDLSRKSKLLYNASLFRIRNIFTGYEKEHLTSNEAEVFGEVKLLHESYPGIHVQKVTSRGFSWQTEDATLQKGQPYYCHGHKPGCCFISRRVRGLLKTTAHQGAYSVI